jgi:inhibitor of cysteine peptidase
MTGVALWVTLAIALLGLTPHSPVFIDRTQPVAVDAGEDFFIALQSNPSTGYSWSQAIADGKIVAYEGNVEQQAWKPLPGAPGQQLFIYHANRTGSTTIEFKYARPWEKNEPPAQTATFHVTVR